MLPKSVFVGGIVHFFELKNRLLLTFSFFSWPLILRIAIATLYCHHAHQMFWLAEAQLIHTLEMMEVPFLFLLIHFMNIVFFLARFCTELFRGTEKIQVTIIQDIEEDGSISKSRFDLFS